MSKLESNVIANNIVIVCALMAEAKAVIKKFKLQHVQTEYGFKRYENFDGRVGLLVSGVGKIHMASALMWLQHYRRFDSFLNVGVMGKGLSTIGTSHLINKVVDEATGRAQYPSINFKWRENVSSLMTVDVPQDDYHSHHGIDMEASAFVQTCRRFVGAEFVHIIKIVSDNEKSDYRQLTAKNIEQFVDQNMDSVEKAVSLLMTHNESVLFDDMLSEMQGIWHITENQKQQLYSTFHFLQTSKTIQCFEQLDWRKFNTVKEYLLHVDMLMQTRKPRL